MDRIVIAVVSFLAGSVLVASAALDKTDCMSGPDIKDPLRYLDQRIVACFNYTNDVEVQNFNKLIGYINDHEARLHALEQRTAPFEPAKVAPPK